MAEKEEKQEFTLYRTSDIYFSAYLSALDIPLECTESEKNEGSGRKKIIFVFKIPTKDLQKMKASFFGGTGTVKVQKYVQQLRSLKSMCFI